MVLQLDFDVGKRDDGKVHVIPLDDNSDLVADTNLRDYESIPFKTDIQEYFQNEVLRFAPDAWMDREKDKIGCEFPISKLFFHSNIPQKNNKFYQNHGLHKDRPR